MAVILPRPQWVCYSSFERVQAASVASVKWYGKYNISQCLVHLFLLKFGFNAFGTVLFIP